MKMKALEFFPVLFYGVNFSQDQVMPLCEEIQDKKEIIKKRYNDVTVTDGASSQVDYWTDFLNTVELLEYEKLIEETSSQFLPEFRCEHLKYWTGIYEKRGYHGTHNHNPMLYDVPSCNMSSILYLSDIGHTEFLNPRQSDEIYPSMFIPSEMGKMVIFPAHILHRALPHGKKDEEKIIVSSNWQILYNLKEDESIFNMR